MSVVDNLPGDQRAVLQLVLGRGRSYDEIARLLSINPDAVRERALTALDTLGPQTKVDRHSRAQICDYLLGQLPEAEIDGVRDLLAESAAPRAWARVVSSELASLAPGPLPEIPLETSAARAAQQPREPGATPALALGADAAMSSSAAATAEQPAAPPPAESGARFGRRRREPKPPKEPKPPRPPKPPREAKPAGDSGSGPRSSRLGGLIVIGLVVAVIIVGIIVLVGGGSKKKSNTIASTPTSLSSTTPAASATTASTTTTGTSTSAKVVAQINLTPPAAGSKAAGIAEVLREGTTNGIAIVAQNVPPNTTKPPNAYAVWLYNSPTDAKILGFVNPGVPNTGKLSTAGGLPANATRYKQLVVTVETSANPKSPGTIILQGTLTGV
jgi:hypothetical protein